MIHRPASILVFVLSLCLVFCSCLSDAETLLLDGINSARVENGLSVLAVRWDLVTIARERAMRLALMRRLSHEGFAESLDGISFSWAGEAIARTNGDSDMGIAQMLLESALHRRVLLCPQANYIGVGESSDGEVAYFVVILVADCAEVDCSES